MKHVKELAPNPSCLIFSQVMMIIFFFLSFSYNAQGLSDDDSSAPHLYEKYHDFIMTIIPAVASALFSIGVLIIILCFCPDSTLSGINHPTITIVIVSDIHSPPVIQTLQLGLDSTVIEAFPLFQYPEVNDIEIGRDLTMLECPVCLSEFEVEETLRLLPKCNHVFHQQCIDTWLANHVTCPVCRANLSPETGADFSQQKIVVADNNLSPSDETNEIISQPDQVAADTVDEERQILES